MWAIKKEVLCQVTDILDEGWQNFGQRMGVGGSVLLKRAVIRSQHQT